MIIWFSLGCSITGNKRRKTEIKKQNPSGHILSGKKVWNELLKNKQASNVMTFKC